jgi:hypothetical protein
MTLEWRHENRCEGLIYTAGDRPVSTFRADESNGDQSLLVSFLAFLGVLVSYGSAQAWLHLSLREASFAKPRPLQALNLTRK